jgi:hypothetical protein
MFLRHAGAGRDDKEISVGTTNWNQNPASRQNAATAERR